MAIMRMMTCKNHPNLRWLCKDIAVNETGNNGLGSYNGQRNIFFQGYLTATGCEDVVDGKIVQECDCSASDLILAPESHAPSKL